VSVSFPSRSLTPLHETTFPHFARCYLGVDASAGHSTWEDFREMRIGVSTRLFWRLLGGLLEKWPTASVTAAWKVTPPASSPAGLRERAGLVLKIASIGKFSR